MLLVKKQNLLSTTRSVVALYLTPKDQDKLGVVNALNFHRVANEGSLKHSTNTLRVKESCKELLSILQDFFNDPETSCLEATWLGPHGQPISWCWIKDE
jgi:hypothetical protein